MCALKWYIKSLYRHLFLEDISKHARVTQKNNFLIGGKLYSQAPWPQRPKLCVRVAKALSCDRMDSLFFPGEPPPPPPPWVIQLRRGGTTEICRTPTQISVVRLFSTLYLRVFFFTGTKKKWIHTITAKAFSYPHTEFGALRSRRLAVKFATD